MHRRPECSTPERPEIQKLLGNVLPKRLAFQQLHHQVGMAHGLADVVNRANVWMTEG